jgi:hypothetical protein
MPGSVDYAPMADGRRRLLRYVSWISAACSNGRPNLPLPIEAPSCILDRVQPCVHASVSQGSRRYCSVSATQYAAPTGRMSSLKTYCGWCTIGVSPFPSRQYVPCFFCSMNAKSSLPK